MWLWRSEDVLSEAGRLMEQEFSTLEEPVPMA